MGNKAKEEVDHEIPSLSGKHDYIQGRKEKRVESTTIQIVIPTWNSWHKR
jgi:hypothetical protein